MICAGNLTPIAAGSAVVELCGDHFEPWRGEGEPAFALHAVGLSVEDQMAAFALVSRAGQAQCFLARWGRTGVGGTAFMPVPAQVDDERPAISVYGYQASNFNWRSCQWEVVERLEPERVDIGSFTGETIELPANGDQLWVFRHGAPLAPLWAANDAALGIRREEESAACERIRFGGRIWRHWKQGDRQPRIELLGFDSENAELQSALDRVWADIGGQEEAKRELIRAIQWPVLYPDLFLLFKRRRSRGVLLYGPPGCGKTLLGKAVVRLLAALYHRKADDGGFKYVKGHQLLDQYVGNSEKAVKALFDDARRFREQRGYPAVLFFDEADALFKRRPSDAREGAFTLVPALLAEMDGMDETGAFVMLATNRPDSLDEAITRPGRIDRRIRVTRPDERAAEVIFRIHLHGVFLEPGLSLDELARVAAAELFSPEHVLYEITFAAETTPFLLKDLASGALVQNIVDRATANKMEYCIAHNVRVGLSAEDIRIAVKEALAEQRRARHAEELEEFAAALGREIVSIRKAV
jgi:DNA polymerase III delta prime subunit